jgi:RHS repeat-associated protein
MLLVALFLAAGLVDAERSFAVDFQAPPSVSNLAQEDAAAPPLGTREVAELRTRESRTYVDDSGVEVTRFFQGSVNYRDSAGKWQPIDNALMPSFTPGFALRNTANRYTAELPPNLGDPVRFSVGDDWVTIELEGAQGPSSTVANEALFSNVLPGTSVEYAPLNDALKETLTLASSTSQRSFRFVLRTSTGLAAQKADGGSIDFVAGKNVRFSLAAPLLQDSSGSPSGISNSVDVSLEKTADGYLLTLSPDATWLDSKKRVWPVKLDPSIYFKSDTECTIFNGSPTWQQTNKCGDPSYPYVPAGAQSGQDPSVMRSLFKFDVADQIPSADEVLDVNFGLYLSIAPPSYGTPISVHRVTRTWTRLANWQTYDGSDGWPPGGEFDPVPADTQYIGNSAVYVRWKPTQLVKGWIDGSIPNQGMILKTDSEPTTGSNVHWFYGSSWFQSQYRPFLEVKWKPQGRYTSVPSKSWVVDGGTDDAPRVNAIKTLENTVYVGGNFSYVGPRTGSFASLKASDASYEPGVAEVAGTARSPSYGSISVRAVAPDGNGGWYIGGDFRYVGGNTREHLAHIMRDGTLDPNWNPGADGEVRALLLHNGSLYVGGRFSTVGGANRAYIARLAASTGSIDLGWNLYVDRPVNSIVVPPGGSLTMYLGGEFTHVGGRLRNHIAAVDLMSGSPILSFTNGTNGYVSSIVSSASALYIGGDFTAVAGRQRNHIAQLDPATGAATLNWNANATGGAVDVMQLSASGRLYVGGGFTDIGGFAGVNGIAAVDAQTGQRDSSWDAQAAAGTHVRALGLSGSLLYVGGDFRRLGGADRGNAAALSMTSALATGWDPRVGSSVYAVGLCTGSPCQGGVDHVAVGGRFHTANATARENLAALDGTTGQPTSWNPSPDGIVKALELARGGLYVGGSFGTIAGQSHSNLALFIAKTGELNGWLPDVGPVSTLHAAGGRIYAGSYLRSIAHHNRSETFVGAWSMDNGDIMDDWDPDPNGPVTSIESDGNTIFLAGPFDTFKGQFFKRKLAAVNGPPAGQCAGETPPSGCPTPGALLGWSPNPDGGDVRDLAIVNGRLYVAGDFSVIAGVAQPRLAAFPTAGGGGPIDDGWKPQVNGAVEAIDADDGGVYVGGRFSSIDGQPRSGLAALDPIHGNAVLPFDPALETFAGDSSSTGTVRALDISDEKLRAGGDWYAVGSKAQTGVASFAGYGYLTEPAEGTTTRRRLTLRAATGSSLFDRVRFEYRWKDESWGTLPIDYVRNATNERFSAWPLSVSDGASPTVVWDLPPSRRTDAPNQGINFRNGPIEVRAVFSNASGEDYTSEAVKVTLDQDAPGTSDAVEQIGPGTLDLLSGNLSVTRDDVTHAGFNSDLTFSRTDNSRAPDAGSDGPFGPGWLSSLPVDAASSDYVRLDVEKVETEEEIYEIVTVTGSDGTRFTFVYFDGQYWPEPGSEDLLLTRDPAGYSVTDLEGNMTVFQSDGTESGYIPKEVRQPGSGNQTTYDYEPIAQGASRLRIHRLYAPGSNSTRCLGQPAQHCRWLEFNYYTCTASAGGTGGGRLQNVSLYAFDPQQNQVRPTSETSYEYDSACRMSKAIDNSAAVGNNPPPCETYTYDASGHLTSLTPPGEARWTLNYAAITNDPNAGRLRSVERKDPNFSTPARTTVLYQVPLTGNPAPYQMGASDVAAWDQQDIPTDATAIFPPSHEPPANPPVPLPATEYHYAGMHYLDRYGREVNVSSPGNELRGDMTTTEWDRHNNLVRALTARNRLSALDAGSASVSRSKELDTQRTFTTDGIDLLEERGPLHSAKVPGGDLAVPARQHTTYSYIDSAYGAPPLHLIAKVTIAAERPGQSPDVDARSTSYGYMNGGLTFRKPTTITVDPGGLNLTSRIWYTPQGLEMERTTPAGNAQGGDAHSTETIYYTAGTNYRSSDCGNRDEWENLPCKVRPAAQPGTPGIPNLPETKIDYNRLYQAVKRTDKVGSTERVTTTTYDDAGRVTGESASGPGALLKDVTSSYDPVSGKPTTTSTPDGTVTRAYDALGRTKEYTDADGGWTRTQYDVYGRVSDVTIRAHGSDTENLGSQTYSYDPVSGRVSRLRDSAVGDFEATYDADGHLTQELYPNDLQATTTYDEAGEATSLSYVKQSNCDASCSWLQFDVTQSIQGQWMSETSGLSRQQYNYDAAGRLTQVDDTPANQGCTRRQYTYDDDSNRLSKVSRTATPGVSCGNGSANTETNSYDSADRLVGPTYGSFGSISTLFRADANGDRLTSDYYSNDLVHSQTLHSANQSTADVTNTYSLDPLRRQHERDQNGPTSSTEIEIYHYSGDSDSPSWTRTSTDNGGTWGWTRNITDIGGSLVGLQSDDGSTELEMSNLHGDIVATANFTLSATGPARTFETDEFGTPKVQDSPPKYGWLGGKQRRTELSIGVVQMGVRSYVPQLGRFLQMDPVPGGSANAYDYSNQDPVNTFDLGGNKPGCGVHGHFHTTRKRGGRYGFAFEAEYRCPTSAWFGSVQVAKATFSITRSRGFFGNLVHLGPKTIWKQSSRHVQLEGRERVRTWVYQTRLSQYDCLPGHTYTLHAWINVYYGGFAGPGPLKLLPSTEMVTEEFHKSITCPG